MKRAKRKRLPTKLADLERRMLLKEHVQVYGSIPVIKDKSHLLWVLRQNRWWVLAVLKARKGLKEYEREGRDFLKHIRTAKA